MSDTMRAVQAGGGGLEDLRVASVPAAPTPASDEVTVTMLAMSINPADLLMLEGNYGNRPQPPFVPGTEGVGCVTAAGQDAGITPGTLVIPMATGAWVERMTVKARHVMPLPDDVDLEQAAMLKANPATAVAMLQDIVALQPGDWVVQNAANSAVGQNVVRVGRALGIKVACVVRRPGAAAVLERLGADAVLIDDGTGDAPRLPDGARARLAFDAVGGPAAERLGAAVADGGTVVTYGLLSGRAPRLSAHDLVFRGLSLRGFWLAQWFQTVPPARVAEVYGQLVGWLAEGRIGAQVAARYPLTDAAAAVAHAAREERDGKVLLTAPPG
ncbi:MAG: zinc-dependent alcohol dehydrogenase family protein [Alkalilacustris sp.]